MKTLQWLATIGLLAAGLTLLVKPIHAQVPVQTRFTVVDAGTVGRPDIVLVPGLSSSRTVWDEEARRLAPFYRLHLVQINGFAGEPAGANATGTLLPALVEALHAYCSSLLYPARLRPVVIGHSLGGLLGLMLAEKYPLDMRKLVVVDTLPFYALLMNPTATVQSAQPMAAAIKAQMLGMPDDQYAAMQSSIAAQLVKEPAGRQLVAASSAASDRAVVVEAMVEDMQTDLRPELAKIKTPTLVLYEYDDSSSVQFAAGYETLVKEGYKPMPNVTLVRVDGSRHFIMYDQPAKFDAALQTFLK